MAISMVAILGVGTLVLLGGILLAIFISRR